MARRHELAGAHWELIRDQLPPQVRGGKWADHRNAFDGVLWRLRTEAPCRDLTERYGPWQTAYHRYNAMRRSSLLERILGRLQARLNAEGVSTRSCPASTAPASGPAMPRRAPRGKGRRRAARPRLGCRRGGLDTKVHLVCDGRGVPLECDIPEGPTPGTLNLSRRGGLAPGVSRLDRVARESPS
jgi:transposase